MPCVQRGKGTAISMCLQPGGDCSLLAPKENQKSASDFDALEPRTRGCSPLVTPKQKSKRKNASRFAKTGCGAQRPLRALSGTRVLLTAAPTAPPCIRRWRRSSPLHFFLASPIDRPLSRCGGSSPQGSGVRPLHGLDSPFGRAGAKRLRGFAPPLTRMLPQGASGCSCRLPSRPLPVKKRI